MLDGSEKTRLLHHALLAVEVRSKLPFATTALHGLLLLLGPPGTGKTTLARALPMELAGLVEGGRARLIEINPHGLMSAEHGQSQQLVTTLLCDHIPALAADGVPTVALLDEVESMAVSRSEASLAANPADVHRATDAVLAAMDRNATTHPHIVAVATSNFPKALDEAFRSRADLTIELPLPNTAALRRILSSTLEGFGGVYPSLTKLSRDARLSKVAAAIRGADGRRARKVVTEALALRLESVLDPNALKIEDLMCAARMVTSPQPSRGKDAKV